MRDLCLPFYTLFACFSFFAVTKLLYSVQSLVNQHCVGSLKVELDIALSLESNLHKVKVACNSAGTPSRGCRFDSVHKSISTPRSRA